jgi:hypothetical protein
MLCGRARTTSLLGWSIGKAVLMTSGGTTVWRIVQPVSRRVSRTVAYVALATLAAFGLPWGFVAIVIILRLALALPAIRSNVPKPVSRFDLMEDAALLLPALAASIGHSLGVSSSILLFLVVPLLAASAWLSTRPIVEIEAQYLRIVAAGTMEIELAEVENVAIDKRGRWRIASIEVRDRWIQLPIATAPSFVDKDPNFDRTIDRLRSICSPNSGSI